MEGIKDFLESSTIHGLTYISTTKNLLVKLFWVCVVTGDFITDGILINSTVDSWKSHPIATTIETFPIDKVKFPKVTVWSTQRHINKYEL